MEFESEDKLRWQIYRSWKVLSALLPAKERSRRQDLINRIRELGDKAEEVREERDELNLTLLVPETSLSPSEIERITRERKELEDELFQLLNELEREIEDAIETVRRDLDLRDCPECGQIFRARVDDHTYCSSACRNRAWRKNKESDPESPVNSGSESDTESPVNSGN